MRVEVTVGDRPFRFLLDSGAGISVVAPWVADLVGIPTGRTVTGRRMSGQEVTAPLVEVPSIAVGAIHLSSQPVGVIDMDPEVQKRFDGILGLDVFADTCLTVDPQRGRFGTGRWEPSEWSKVVSADVEATGEIREMFVPLVLPSGQIVRALVDTGAEPLVLDERFRGDCGVEAGDRDFTTVERRDETGAVWRASIGVISGGVHVEHHPNTRQDGPKVVFRSIIHEAVLGMAFLDRFRLGFDVRGHRLGISPSGIS
jgi:predicted aspartyl protease